MAMARAWGSGDRENIRKTVHTAMLLAFVIGVFLTGLGVALAGTLLAAINTPQGIIGLATVYLRTYFYGMVPYMVYNFGAALLQAVGQTKKPLNILMISGPLKLATTVLFVEVFCLDVAGLALATVCSQLVSAVLAVGLLMRQKNDCKLCLRELKFHTEPLKKILRLGIPSGIQSSTFTLSNVFVQASVNSLSYLPGFIKGDAAACSIGTFANAITTAFYQVSINYTGQNAGAYKFDRVKRGYFTVSGLGCGMIAVVSALVCLFSERLLGLYIIDFPEAIHWGTVRLMFLFGPLVLQGLMDMTSGALRGLEVSASSMLVTLIGMCGFRILWGLTIFWIPRFHTPQVLYLCYPVSWTVTYLAELALYIAVYKKKRARAERILGTGR